MIEKIDLKVPPQEPRIEKQIRPATHIIVEVGFRESGYYWIKSPATSGEWQPAFFSEGVWFYDDERSDCVDRLIPTEIHPERIKEPNEK